MENKFLIVIVGLIIASSITFVAIWNSIPQECDEQCELERRRIGAGHGGLDTLELSEEPKTWKEYITLSASKIEKNQLENIPIVSKLDDLFGNPILHQLLVGADGCKNETEICKISGGVSLDRHYSFGVRISDQDTYSVTLDSTQANDLLEKLDWVGEGDFFYTGIQWNEKNYFLSMSESETSRTPDVVMKILGTQHEPVALKPANTLNYTVQIQTWATYGADAKIELVAINNVQDSGIMTWIEPKTLFVPERSSANATLFIRAQDNARDGIYDIRVIGQANEKGAGLYCRNTICPTINVGNSDWSIRTFGPNSNMGIGAGPSPENTSIELELNKNEFHKEDLVEIKTYLVNNSDKKIEFVPREMLIKVIKAQDVGYYDNLYGITTQYESDTPISLEPHSKTLLVRPFYWDQTIQSIDGLQRLDPRQHKMVVTFVGDNYTWKDDLWFTIK